MKSVLLVMCAALLGMNLTAVANKKEILKSFDKAGVSELTISNKYGQIEVEQAEGDQILVAVTVAVTAKSDSKADGMLEFINVRDTKSGNYINVETEFGKDMTFQQLLSSLEVHVDYKVTVPKGIKVRLINTDGNIYVSEFAGDMNVDLKTGNFKAGSMKEGELYVKQHKGEFRIASVDFLTGDFKACVLKIENGDEVKLETNDTDGTLESINKLTLRTSGGTMRLGEIEDMRGSSSFTKYEVQDIGDVLNMDLKMGELNVRNIHFNFSAVEVKGSFAKVGLTFMEGAGYNLDLKHNKSLKMDLPNRFKLEKQPTSQKNVIMETGFIGDPKYKGKVILNLSNGNLYIQ